MKSLIVAVGISALAGIAGAQGTSAEMTRPLSGIAVAGQVSTGVLGTAIGFFGGGLATRRVALKLGHDQESAGRIALVGAYSIAVVTTAVGPSLIGSHDTPKGSFGAAIGGAAAGLTVSAILRKLGRKGAFGERGPIAMVVGAAIAALPSIGATIAFNSTR